MINPKNLAFVVTPDVIYDPQFLTKEFLETILPKNEEIVDFRPPRTDETYLSADGIRSICINGQAMRHKPRLIIRYIPTMKFTLTATAHSPLPANIREEIQAYLDRWPLCSLKLKLE